MASLLVNALMDPTTWVVFLTVLFLAWVVYPRKKYKHPPGPTNWPIIGSTIQLMTSKYGSQQFFQFMEWAEKYGSVIRVKSIFGDMVVINSIEPAMEALVTKSAEYAGRMHTYTFDRFTDGGKDIALADYSERVKYQRRISGAALRNLLSGHRLREMTHASVRKGLNMFREEAKRHHAFEPNELLYVLVYNIICAMCFNINFEVDDPVFKSLYTTAKEGNEAFGTGIFLEDFFPPARYLPKTKAMKTIQNFSTVWFTYIKEQLEMHKESFDADNLRDFLDHMLKAEQENPPEGGNGGRVVLTDDHYKQTIADIFSAGTDTTSMTLIWIIYILAEYQDIQSKVQDEIDTVVGNERLPDGNDKPKMPYSEAVMYEAMRFATIGPIGVPHKTMCDTTLGEYDVPKDTVVIINHHALHRDPKQWNNPDQFDPNNFLDAEGKLLPKPRSFLPFGAGKRVCIGEAVAKPEIFMIYTSLLQHFRVKFEEGHVRDLSFDSTKGFIVLPRPFKIVIEERLERD